MSLLLVMRDISGNHLHKIYHTPHFSPDPSTSTVLCGKRFHIRKWCTLKPNK